MNGFKRCHYTLLCSSVSLDFCDVYLMFSVSKTEFMIFVSPALTGNKEASLEATEPF